ncbi:MAG: fasciclin domain-containing protein [Saccharopolyspora sp.]|uniref:fasciclin domain-containing protein n=1 Tax=Saccharopolyspora TaxID=1835 RepID=UPI00190A88B0|nr:MULTISPECIES: fasciclin domain-containing protein [unclassified Saccharopolyspora]MBK0867901.1 fasciclin domain-containing protein [Saccharopolyspora sp. HNM0986]MBQ6639736.1 fasciclin domain-containing protein [Saccharopolyspora sp.]
MRIRRQAAALTGSAAVLALALSACGQPAQDSAESAAPGQPPAGQPAAQPAANGVTTAEDVFGPGCSQVPTDPNDPGSVQGMVDDPVGTAASNNPLLTKLTAAVQAAGLVDTLNKPDAQYTVFAPADPAFEAIPQDQLEAMLTDPAQKQQLTDVLTYHVVPQRMDAEGLAGAGTLPTAQGGQLKVEGSGENLKVNGASVLCGNVPTANATVFVVDKVLMPQM